MCSLRRFVRSSYLLCFDSISRCLSKDIFYSEFFLLFLSVPFIYESKLRYANKGKRKSKNLFFYFGLQKFHVNWNSNFCWFWFRVACKYLSQCNRTSIRSSVHSSIHISLSILFDCLAQQRKPRVVSAREKV